MSSVHAFLDRFGDQHMDRLQRRLSDFINVASELRFHGVIYVGPPRHTNANILMACKEMVETTMRSESNLIVFRTLV